MGYIDDKVSSLTGIDITTETNQDYIQDWIKDSIRELYSIVPKVEKYKFTSLSASKVAASTGVDVTEPILGVFWFEGNLDGDDAGYECREIPYTKLFEVNKFNSILKPHAQDPIYYLEPQGAGSTQKVKALPSGGYMKVLSLDMTTANTDPDTLESVINIPNELDHLIVLLTSVKATNFLLQSEQDDDIYVPLLSSLRADYQQALQMYLAQFRIQPPNVQAPSKSQGSKATAEELQALMQKYQ